MADEGSRLEMTELVLQEKELRAKLEALEEALREPEAKLEKAKAILLKAKAAYEEAAEVVRPLRSEKVLAEGELELVLEKKAKVRQAARMLEAGGIRPGTAELVEGMNRLAGDPEEASLKKAAKELDVEDALAALKKKLEGEAGG